MVACFLILYYLHGDLVNILKKIFSSQGSLNSLDSSYSVTSARSKAPLKEDMDRNITWKDVQLILPTVLILLFTVLVMVTVIPYAFSTVFRQMEAVRAMEAAGTVLYQQKKHVNIYVNPISAAMAKAVSEEAVTKAKQLLVKNITEDL